MSDEKCSFHELPPRRIFKGLLQMCLMDSFLGMLEGEGKEDETDEGEARGRKPLFLYSAKTTFDLKVTNIIVIRYATLVNLFVYL